MSLLILPGLPLPFLHTHTASDQKLDGGKVWEQGYRITSCLNSTNTVPQLTLPGYTCTRNILVVQSFIQNFSWEMKTWDGLDCVYVNHVHLPRGSGACFPRQILVCCSEINSNIFLAEYGITSIRAWWTIHNFYVRECSTLRISHTRWWEKYFIAGNFWGRKVS